MTEVFVEKIKDFAEGDRCIVFNDGGNAIRLFNLKVGAEKLAQTA